MSDESSPDSDADGDGGPESEATAESDGRPAPLADLAADVDSRRERGTGDPFEDAFAEQPFEPVEGEAVRDAGEEDADSEFGAVGEVVEAGVRTFVVSKRNFCERCRFFSEPPEAHCTHEGTEIREFVDMDHVRVHSCPIVEERGLDGTGRDE